MIDTDIVYDTSSVIQDRGGGSRNIAREPRGAGERQLLTGFDCNESVSSRCPFNPLCPKSDQHQISPCKIIVKESGHENYGHDHTK